jgi:predicted metal-dependent peptidase
MVFEKLLQKFPQVAGCSMCSGQGGGKQDGQGQCGGHKGVPAEFDEHGVDEAAGWSKEEQTRVGEEIDSAIRQGSILAGQMAGNIPRAFGELMKVKVDWRQQLRQFFTDTCIGEGELSYARPNRRWLQHDVIFPTEVCETLPRVLFMIDTSGSIGGDDLTYFGSNLAMLLKTVNPEQVDVIFVDTEVAGHEVYKQGEYDTILSKLQPKGGGGTSFRCVSDWIQKEGITPTCLVALTDAYVSSWPEDLGIPTIWCVYQNESAQIPFGQVTHI